MKSKNHYKQSMNQLLKQLHSIKEQQRNEVLQQVRVAISRGIRVG